MKVYPFAFLALAIASACSDDPEGPLAKAAGEAGASGEATTEPVGGAAGASPGGAEAGGAANGGQAGEAIGGAAGGLPGAPTEAGAGGEAGGALGGTGGAGGEAGAVSEVVRVARVWLIGQEVAIGPATGSPPPETPLSDVPMWLCAGTLNFNSFTVLRQPPGYGHGGELQAGVDLWKAGVRNVQIKIAAPGTSAVMWSETGKQYSVLKEEVAQVLTVSEQSYPGAIFTDHLVLNLGQVEATGEYESGALQHGQGLNLDRIGFEALLGHPVTSLHIELTQLTLPNAKWVNTVRKKQLAVPDALFVNYDDVLTDSPVGQNVLGARRAASILEALQ